MIYSYYFGFESMQAYGGRRIVTCLGAKEFCWPKDLSGGLEFIKQIGGLDKAQPVAPMSSKIKGILV